VAIEKYLVVEFRSPAPFAKSDFWSQTNPNVDINAVVTNTLDGSEFIVTVELHITHIDVPTRYPFNPNTKLTFAINGDLTEKPDYYTGSFKFTAH